MTKREHTTKSRIPECSSVQEEAEFWDTHDTTDFEDEFTAVQVRFAENLSEGLHIRLDPDTLAELRREAREKDIGPTTLARMWIMERWQQSPRGS